MTDNCPSYMNVIGLIFRTVVDELLGDAHRTEVRTAHCAEMVIILMALDVILACARRVERQVELVFPAEFKTRLAHGIVAQLCARMAFCDVGGMGCYLICDHAVAHVFEIRQRKVFFGCHIAYHRSAHPCYLCSSDGRRDVVVAGGDVGCERAEGVCVLYTSPGPLD